MVALPVDMIHFLPRAIIFLSLSIFIFSIGFIIGQMWTFRNPTTWHEISCCYGQVMWKQ